MSESLPVTNALPFIKDALARFKVSQDAEQEARRAALEDLKFLEGGGQWPDQIKKQRESEGRPCLTINRLPQFLRQVTNEQRQNRPAVKVSPVDDDADPDTAEIIQGIIRHIEYESNADVAYDTAFEFAAATGGPGWVRIDPEYDDDGKNQVLRIGRVRNPFIVYDDPSAQKADRSDSKWRFFVENLTREEYTKLYPNSQLASLDDWKSVGDQVPGWMEGNTVRVAEYFYFEDEDEADSGDDLSGGEQSSAGVSEERTGERGKRGRKTKPEGNKPRKQILHWVKMNAVEELDRTVIECKWIPSVPVFGDEMEIDGKLVFKGIVRDARDPQRMYNYWASAETEAIALAPKAPFKAPAGAIAGFEPIWGTANTKNHAVLPYNAYDDQGRTLPAPERDIAEPAVQAITQARLASSDDLKATTGIYDAQLGAKSNEQTGKAILARQNQSQVANFHYIDNLSRAIRHVGRILLDMIPTIYDTKRVLRIVGEEGDTKTVTVNSKFTEGGVEKIYDLTVGKYDVTVSAGPSYQTRRQEAVQSIMALVSAQPALVNICGDLLVKMMDWPMHEEVAERLKKMLPPQLQDNEGEQPPIPPQVQAQMAQMGQQLQAINAYAQKLEQEKQGKLVEAQARFQIAQMQESFKLEIEKLHQATQLAVAQINASKDANQSYADREMQQYEILHQAAHDIAMQKDQQAHEQQLAQQQAQVAAASQASDQAHQQQMAQDSASSENGQAGGESNG